MDGPLDVEVMGFKARLDPRDNLSDKRALLQPRAFDAQEREALGAAVRRGFVFIDGGANTGLYSLFVAARAGPLARVLAVEPAPAMRARLAFNAAANGFANISVVDAALAEGRGRAVLQLGGRNQGEGALADAGPGLQVHTLGLLDLMDEHGLSRADAVKLDIEGAEDRVLPAFFEACPPQRLPQMILMETLSKSWRIDCVALAQRQGYRAALKTRRNIVLVRPEPGLGAS